MHVTIQVEPRIYPAQYSGIMRKLVSPERKRYPVTVTILFSESELHALYRTGLIDQTIWESPEYIVISEGPTIERHTNSIWPTHFIKNEPHIILDCLNLAQANTVEQTFCEAIKKFKEVLDSHDLPEVRTQSFEL
jgi:hypothetical protein